MLQPNRAFASPAKSNFAYNQESMMRQIILSSRSGNGDDDEDQGGQKIEFDAHGAVKKI